MTDSLETNSRTLKQARRGQVELFASALLSLVGVVTALAHVDRIVQIIIGAAVALILIGTYFRFIRVKRYRRQDHTTRKVRKPEDTEDGA